MQRTFTSLAEFLDHGHDCVIDVRAPAEFAEDHVPGAVNMPVLDDAERARVGTIHKQQSSFDARKIGAALVARNAARHIETRLMGHDGGWRPLVYCWRGGQRSGSFATILAQVGWRVQVVEGGYRSYRRMVQGNLYETVWPGEVILLDGNTGTAKTRLIALLSEAGVQTLDLEGLAGHRGSVFGSVGEQPAQKGFETALAAAMSRLDPARPLLVEAESNKIGARSIPPALWGAMKRGRRIEVTAPVAERVGYLVTAYADIASDIARLEPLIESLRPFLGGELTDLAITQARGGQMADLAALLVQHHYDPRYGRQRGTGQPAFCRVEMQRLDAAGLQGTADRIAAVIGA